MRPVGSSLRNLFKSKQSSNSTVDVPSLESLSFAKSAAAQASLKGSLINAIVHYNSDSNINLGHKLTVKPNKREEVLEMLKKLPFKSV